MSRRNVMIYTSMRPPVAAERGKSPLRGKDVHSVFQLANGKYMDKSGYRITRDQIVQNCTDQGKLQDARWDQRHHVSPSHFNIKNTKHYKQYFDKEFRNRDQPLLPNKRELDPYEANEVKGTRMPTYTKVDRERDIYGELAWNNYHNVKCSKDNDETYPTQREFFDGPRNYNKKHSVTATTSNEFYRKSAPKKSVARINRPKLRSLFSKSPQSMTRFFTQ